MEPKYLQLLVEYQEVVLAYQITCEDIINFILCFCITHVEILYCKEIFQSVHSRFLNALDHLQSHPGSVDNIETTTFETSTSHDYLKKYSFWIREDSDVYF